MLGAHVYDVGEPVAVIVELPEGQILVLFAVSVIVGVLDTTTVTVVEPKHVPALPLTV